MRSDPTCDDGLKLDTWLRDFQFEAPARPAELRARLACAQAAPPPKTFEYSETTERRPAPKPAQRTGIIGDREAVVTDPKAFRSDRDFAAWVELIPRLESTGGKQKLGRSKQGERYLRCNLVLGARAVLKRARPQPELSLPRTKRPRPSIGKTREMPGEGKNAGPLFGTRSADHIRPAATRVAS
jgi:transposase IS116/IS110/IS902 family protein